MSVRRASRRLLILAGLLPIMVGLWGTMGAQAAGGAHPADCNQAVGDASNPLISCGGPATHFIFSIQPGGAQTGQPLSPQPVVEAVDDQGNVDGTYSQIVTLTIGSNPGGGTLHGTASVAASGGVATYTDLSIDQPGVGYTLVANGDAQPQPTFGAQPADALPPATSDPFDITPPPGPAPARCGTIYGVTDANNNSRFFSVGSFSPHTLTPLGGVQSGANFEGIDIRAQGNIYAATAGANRNGQKGMIFHVDGLTGALTPAVSTGFKDVEGLAFRPSDDALWAWVDGKGLILMDVTLPFPASLAVPSHRQFEALAWNNAGDKLYLAEKNKLWTWDPSTLAFLLVASNLPGPVLGLDVRPLDGNLLLAVAKSKIIVWNPVTHTTVGTIPTPGFKPTQSLAESEPCEVIG